MGRSRIWFTSGRGPVESGVRGAVPASRRTAWRTATTAFGASVAFAAVLAPMPGTMQSQLLAQQLARADDRASEPPTCTALPAAGDAADAGPAVRRLTGDEAGDIAAMVTSAERLSIRFHGHPTLTGDYNVHADDTVSMPMIGRIVVRGLTLAALERQLRAEMLRLTGREAFVTVDVSVYRDVFISGFVSRAGAFQWKRGMMVQHTMSLSGGAFRPTTSSGSTMVSETERLRARRAAAELGRNLIIIQRLAAERANRATFEADPRARQLLKGADAAAFEAAQQAVLASRLAFAQTRISSLKSSADIAREELAALMQQSDAVIKTLSKRSPRLAAVQELRGRGIVTEDRVQTEEGRLSELHERKASISVSMARVKSAQAGSERSLAVFESERRAEVELELQRLQRETALLEVEYASAGETLATLTGTTALEGRLAHNASFDRSISRLSFEIVRNQDGLVKTIAANENTAIYPGDLVRVELTADH